MKSFNKDILIDDDIKFMMDFKNGDVTSFEKLVDKYKKPVLNTIYRLINQKEDAEDLTQEVFLKIYQSAEKYTPQAKFTTWLYKIVYNTSFSYLKKRKNFKPLSLEVESTIPDKALSIEEQVIQAETAEGIKKAVDSLPVQQRMAIILKQYDDLSYEEIAEIMKTSVSSVKSLLFRARENLKDRLKAYYK